MTTPDWYKPPATDVAIEALEAWQPQTDDTVGFWSRVAARLLGAIVAFAVGVVAAMVASALRSFVAVPSLSLAVWPSIGLSLVVSTLTETLGESVGGATPAKLLLGYRVRMEDGTMCTVGAAFKRALLYLWDAFFFGLVAYSAMKSSMMNQRVGDRWGGTVVVRASAIPKGARSDQRAIVGALLMLAVPFVHQLFIHR